MRVTLTKENLPRISLETFLTRGRFVQPYFLRYPRVRKNFVVQVSKRKKLVAKNKDMIYIISVKAKLNLN